MTDSQTSVARLASFCRLLTHEGLSREVNSLSSYIAKKFEVQLLSYEFVDLINAHKLAVQEARSELNNALIGSPAKEKFFGYLQTVSDMLHMGVHNSASVYAKRITPELISGLELLDERLNSIGVRQTHPNLETRSDIQQQIEAVREALASSGIDVRLGAWALSELARVEFLVRWSAHASSHEALNILLGVIARLALERARTSDKPKKEKIVKVMAALTVAAVAISQANAAVNDGKELIASVVSGLRASQALLIQNEPKLITDQTTRPTK